MPVRNSRPNIAAISQTAIAPKTAARVHVVAPVLFSYSAIHRILERHGISPHFPKTRFAIAAFRKLVRPEASEGEASQ